MKKALLLALTAAVLFGCTADGVFTPPNNPDNPTPSHVDWSDGGKVFCKMIPSGICLEVSKAKCDYDIGDEKASRDPCTPGTEPITCLVVKNDDKFVGCGPSIRSACTATGGREVESCDGIKTTSGSGGGLSLASCQANFVPACCNDYYDYFSQCSGGTNCISNPFSPSCIAQTCSGSYATFYDECCAYDSDLPQCDSGGNGDPYDPCEADPMSCFSGDASQLVMRTWKAGIITAETNYALYWFPIYQGITYHVFLDDIDNSTIYNVDAVVSVYSDDHDYIIESDYGRTQFMALETGMVVVQVEPYGSGIGTFRVAYSTTSTRP